MNKQSKVKYNRLIETAEKLFIENGYKNISMDEIAQKANISKVTIYKYFESKENLFIKIALEITKKHYDVLEKELENIKSNLDKIKYIFDYNLDKYGDFSKQFLSDMMKIDFIWKEIYSYRLKRAKELLRNILNEGINNGEIRELDIENTLTILVEFGKMLPNILSFDDNNDAEERIFLKAYYDFLAYGLTN